MKSGQKWILNSNKGHTVICKIITVINNALRPAGIDIDLCKNTAPPPPPPPPNGKVYLMPAVDAGRSAVHSCRGAGASEPPGRLTRRSFSDSFHSVTARIAGWLRRAAVVSLLGLPLLTVFATGAQAQGAAVECTGDGPYEVPYDWALNPSGVSGGDSFRLLFVTSTMRNAVPTDVATYNTFVQTRAKAGHSAITDSCGDEFKVVGSTSAVDARDNTSTTGVGQVIYWLDGAKVADNYADFYDGSWDSYAGKTEAGSNFGGNTFIFTGSNQNGTKASFGATSRALGASSVRAGRLQSGQNPINSGLTVMNNRVTSFYALSPVFTVEPQPTVSISIDPAAGDEGNSGGLTDAATLTFTVNPPRPEGFALRICLGGGTAERGSSADYQFTFLNNTVPSSIAPAPGCDSALDTNISSNQASFSYKIRVNGDSLFEEDETVTVSLLRINNLGGNLDTPDDVIISPTAGSVTYTIQNDDTVPELTITAADMVTEGSPASFTIAANPASGLPITVNLMVSEADGDGNFVASGDKGPKSFLLPAGVGSARYEIDTVYDNTDVENGTLTVALATGDGYTIGSTNTAVVAIINEEPHVVSMSIEPAEGDEGNSGGLTDAATLTFTVNPPRPERFMFRICLDGGTAERGSSADYQYTFLNDTVPSFSVPVAGCDSALETLFNSNQASFSQKIRVNGDSLFEEDETVTVSLQRVNDTPDDVIISPTAGSVTYTIQNDDTVPELTITAADMVTEGSTAIFTITANPASGLPTRVNLMVSEADDDNFVASGDKGPKPFLLPAGVGFVRYEIDTVLDNTIGDDNDGTLTVALATGDGYTIGSTNTAVVAIINEEPHVVSMSIEPEARAEGSSGGFVDAATVTFTVDPPRSAGFDLALCAPGGNIITAERGSSSSADYQYTDMDDTALGFTNTFLGIPCRLLTFNGGISSLSHKIRVNGDSVFENDEIFQIRLRHNTFITSQAIGGSVTPFNVVFSNALGVSTANYTIRNDDDPPMISIAGGSPNPATEGAGTLTYTLTADKPPATDLTIDLTVMDAPGSDFIAAEGDQNVTFPAGTTALNYEIPITDDEVDEASGEVTVTINDGTGYTAGTDTATIRVRDDDRTTVTLAENPAGDLDEGARKQITLTVNRPLGGRGSLESLTVQLTFGGTATLGTDYTLTGISATRVGYGRLDRPGIIINFSGPSNESTATTATLILTTTADGVSDSGEDITIAVINVSNAAGLDGGVGVIGTSTIAFDIIEQPALVLNPSTLTIDEGDTATYTVSLATQPNAAVAIALSGQAGTDLTLSDDTLNFTMMNWNQPQTITVTAGSDDDAQSDDPIALLHTATGGDYATVTGEVTVTITEDDTAGITVQPTTLAVDEDGTATYTVVLTSAPAPASEVIITVDSGTVATVDNDMLTFTQSNWNQAQTVTVTGMDDAVHNAGDVRSGTITHAISQGDSGDYPIGRELDRVQLTVADNDDPALSVQVVGDHTSIEEGGARMIQITVSPDTGETFTLVDVRLLLDISDGYELTLDQTDTSLDPTLQFEVSVTDNDQDGADGMLTIDVSSVTGYAAGSPATLQLTVNDNDEAGITVQPTTLTVDEGGTDSYSVALTSQPAASVTVTATPGTGITMTDTTLTFTSTDWNEAQTLIVTGQDDEDANDGGQRQVAISHAVTSTDTTYNRAADSVSVTVRDDDDITVSFAAATVSVGEGAGTGTFRIMLSATRATDLTVGYTEVGGSSTAVVGTDYTALSGSVVVPAGDRQADIVVTLTDDSTVAADKTLTLSLTDGSGYVAADPDTAVMTIVNDDRLQVAFEQERYTVIEAAGAVSLNVVASGDSDLATTLAIRFTDGTAIAGTDYTGDAITSITIPAGVSAVEFDVPITEDGIDEVNEGFMAVLSVDPASSAVAEPGTSSRTQIVITDDDPTVVSLNYTGADMIEEGDTVEFTVALGRALTDGEIIDVPLSVTGTGVELADWSLALQSGTGVVLSKEDTMTPQLSFENAGAQSAQLTLTAIGDNTMEGSGSETFIIALGPDGTVTNGFDHSSLNTNVGGGADPDSPDHFSVQVNDAIVMPMITITGGTTVTEGMGSASFTLTATPPPTDALTLMLNISGGSGFIATSGAQTVALNGGSRTVTYLIATQGDAVDEPNGTVTVTVGNGTGYEVGDPSEVSVGVHDDDATTVTLVGDPGNVAEGSSKPLTLTLGRVLTAGEQLTVPLTFGGTALFGTDYTLTGTAANGVDYSDLSGGSVIFSAGGQMATLTLMAQTDAEAETGGETVRIALGTLDSSSGINLGGGASGMGNVDFTIQEQPALVLSTTRLTLIEGDSATYRISLAAAPSANVVMVTIEGTNAELEADDTTLTFTSQNWGNPQTVTLTAVTDSNTVMDQVTLTHTADAGYDSVTADLEVTITDSSPQLQFSGTEIELDEGGTTSYTVRLSARPIAEVTVMLSGHADTSLTVNPLALTFSTMNWNETQVITLTAGTDSNSVDEAAVTLVHTADAGFGEVSRDVTVTITDTDTPDSTGNLVLSESSLDMGENDTASYTVVLGTRPSGDVTVRVSSGDATRLRVTGGDSLLFTPTNWNRAQTVTVMARDDADSDANQVILTHTADAGYGEVTEEVTVTVRESADMTAMQAAQQMWLPRFGLTAVEHMLGGLDYRFSASSQPGLSGNLNGLPRGQSFNAAHLLSSRGSPDASAMGIEQLGAGSSDRPRKLSRTLSLPKLLPSLLRGSHFTFTDQDGTSIWGQAAYTKYKDGEDAGTSIDGEVTTAMLGIDRDNGQTLVGLALAYSDSDGEWQDASYEGKQSGMLVSMLPYLRYDLSERLQLWGAASYGRGDLKQTQTSPTGMESKHNLVQLSATAGLRGTLLERPVEEGGLTLELISGLTLARIKSDDSRVMAGTEADTQRFRMGLAWSWQLPEEDGVRLTPELELGLRYDGGDTSEGFGLELGGGLSWQTPAKGLTVDVRGRYLLEHEAAEREEWGLSGSLRYEAWPNSAYGPSFSLRHEYGNAPAASGLDRLLSDSLTDALEEEDNGHTAAVSSRWTLKGEWGFALTDDATGIPYASLSASDAKRDLTLGWRLLSNPFDLTSELDIKAIRREQDDNNPRHSVGAQWKLNW